MQAKSRNLREPRLVELTAVGFDPQSNSAFFIRALPKSGEGNAHLEVRNVCGLSFQNGALRFEGKLANGKPFQFEGPMQQATPAAFWTLFHRYQPPELRVYQWVDFQEAGRAGGLQERLGRLGIRFFDVERRIYHEAPSPLFSALPAAQESGP